MAFLSVLISGGGIAGTTLAHWLSAAGHHVTIVERAESAFLQWQPGRCPRSGRRHRTLHGNLAHTRCRGHRGRTVGVRGRRRRTGRHHSHSSHEEGPRTRSKSHVPTSPRHYSAPSKDRSRSAPETPSHRCVQMVQEWTSGSRRPRRPVRRRGGSRWRPLRHPDAGVRSRGAVLTPDGTVRRDSPHRHHRHQPS